MADVQVRCINKLPRNDTHHAITHLGGQGWKWTRQEVISSIKAATNTFHTVVNGKRAEVAVNRNEHGEFLQTHADGYWNNNLLALSECVG